MQLVETPESLDHWRASMCLPPNADCGGMMHTTYDGKDVDITPRRAASSQR